MIRQIFTLFDFTLESPLMAPAAAFIWGILSILLSPCHLASIPLIVAFIDRRRPLSTKRACACSSLFAAGILITIAAIGVATASAGRLFGGIGPWANYLVAAVFFVVGLHLLDVFPLPARRMKL